MAINATSKIRYQVFISSTYKDLMDEREEVIRALLELDCIPAGMELFPATNDEQLALIKQVIDDCDYYVVIVGGRYGSVDATGISYTEQEYDYAESNGIPILGFIHANPDNIAAGKTDLDGELQKKLEAFRKKVEKHRVIKKYNSASELGGHVSRSLIQEIKKNPRTGWIRADDAVPPETIAELNTLRKQLAETEDKIKAQTLVPPPGTEKLMQGDDTVELHWKGETRDQADYLADSVKINGVWEASWNTLFKFLGPLMLDEAGETILERRLRDAALEDVRQIEGAENIVNRTFSIIADDFQAVKMQFFALGLISKSEKKRTASDKATYWSLTPYGERKLVELRALKK